MWPQALYTDTKNDNDTNINDDDGAQMHKLSINFKHLPYNVQLSQALH